MRRFRHLSKTDRLRIEAHARDGKTPKEIAEIIGVHISTIYRELKRGQYEHLNSDYTTDIRYSPDIADSRYRENLRAKGPQLKIGKDRRLAEYIEDRIIERKYSPAAVLGEIRALGLKFDTTISTTTLYSYIDKGIFLRLTNKDLPVKPKKKRKYHKVKNASRPPKGESIENRPEEVDRRETFGHWEMDTVVSARPSKKALLVLSERLTRNEIIRQLKDKTTDSVVQALNELEHRYGDPPGVQDNHLRQRLRVRRQHRHRAKLRRGGQPDQALLLPPIQRLRAGHQREHQQADPPVPPKRNELRGPDR